MQKNINLCKAWARHSASSEHLSCSAPEHGTEWRQLERAHCIPRDTMLTKLTCAFAFHLYYSVHHEGKGAENEAEGFKKILRLHALSYLEVVLHLMLCGSLGAATLPGARGEQSSSKPLPYISSFEKRITSCTAIFF